MSDIQASPVSERLEREDFRESLGKAVNFHELDFDIKLRRYTLLKRVWKPNAEELTWLTALFLRKATASSLWKILNTNHDWKDRVEFNNKLYDLEFIDMNLDMLEDMCKNKSTEELIISIRENNVMNFYVFLVKKSDGPIRGYIKDLL